MGVCLIAGGGPVRHRPTAVKDRPRGIDLYLAGPCGQPWFSRPIHGCTLRLHVPPADAIHRRACRVSCRVGHPLCSHIQPAARSLGARRRSGSPMSYTDNPDRRSFGRSTRMMLIRPCPGTVSGARLHRLPMTTGMGNRFSDQFRV